MKNHTRTLVNQRTAPLRERSGHSARMKTMKFNAVVRRKKGPATEMKILHASEIREAAEIVRAAHGLWGDDPHKGYTINEERKDE